MSSFLYIYALIQGLFCTLRIPQFQKCLSHVFITHFLLLQGFFCVLYIPRPYFAFLLSTSRLFFVCSISLVSPLFTILQSFFRVPLTTLYYSTPKLLSCSAFLVSLFYSVLLYSKASFVFRFSYLTTLYYSTPDLLSCSAFLVFFIYLLQNFSKASFVCSAFLVLFICILSPFAPLKLLSCVPLSLSYLPLSLHQSFFRMFIMFPSTSFACSIFITLFITHLSPSKLLSYVYHVFFHFYRVYPCLSKKLTTVTSILFIPIYFDQLLPSCFLFLLPQLPQIWIFVAINFKILPQIYYSFSSSVLIYIYIYYFFRLYKKK
jgi:hypothetical protein